MSRLTDKQDQAMQAIGQVARLGGLAIKKITVADDLENVTLTVTFTGISQGWQQEALPFEVEDLRAHVNGRGEVEKIDGLKPGDLAETEAEANEEIAALKEAAAIDEPRAEVAQIPADGSVVELSAEDEPKPEIHLVGEAAAAARKRR